jgi:hypothetical protein
VLFLINAILFVTPVINGIVFTAGDVLLELELVDEDPPVVVDEEV